VIERILVEIFAEMVEGADSKETVYGLRVRYNAAFSSLQAGEVLSQEKSIGQGMEVDRLKPANRRGPISRVVLLL
jgi:hypothetical protein